MKEVEYRIVRFAPKNYRVYQVRGLLDVTRWLNKYLSAKDARVAIKQHAAECNVKPLILVDY
jgi:hypothetical protein